MNKDFTKEEARFATTIILFMRKCSQHDKLTISKNDKGEVSVDTNVRERNTFDFWK